MPIKITGRELREWDLESEEWFADNFGELHDDLFDVGGDKMPLEDAVQAAADDTIVVVVCGYARSTVSGETIPLPDMIRRWKKGEAL